MSEIKNKYEKIAKEVDGLIASYDSMDSKQKERALNRIEELISVLAASVFHDLKMNQRETLLKHMEWSGRFNKLSRDSLNSGFTVSLAVISAVGSIVAGVAGISGAPQGLIGLFTGIGQGGAALERISSNRDQSIKSEHDFHAQVSQTLERSTKDSSDEFGQQANSNLEHEKRKQQQKESLISTLIRS